MHTIPMMSLARMVVNKTISRMTTASANASDGPPIVCVEG